MNNKKNTKDKKKNTKGRPPKYDWKSILSKIAKVKKSLTFKAGKDFDCSCFCFYSQVQRELRKRYNMSKKYKVTFDDRNRTVQVTKL